MLLTVAVEVVFEAYDPGEADTIGAVGGELAILVKPVPPYSPLFLKPTRIEGIR